MVSPRIFNQNVPCIASHLTYLGRPSLTPQKQWTMQDQALETWPTV